MSMSKRVYNNLILPTLRSLPPSLIYVAFYVKRLTPSASISYSHGSVYVNISGNMNVKQLSSNDFGIHLYDARKPVVNKITY